MNDEELTKLAAQELVKESKRAAERVEALGPEGWKKCPTRGLNKRFLISTLRDCVSSNKRKSEKKSSSHVESDISFIQDSIRDDRTLKKMSNKNEIDYLSLKHQKKLSRVKLNDREIIKAILNLDALNQKSNKSSKARKREKHKSSKRKRHKDFKRNSNDEKHRSSRKSRKSSHNCTKTSKSHRDTSSKSRGTSR